MQSRAIFLGRTRELVKLAELSRAGAKLVTLWGPGGAGKTTLAQRCAEHERAGGEHVVWADLTTSRTATEVAATLAAALGVTLDPRDDLTEALARAAAAQEAVLIADNAEQLDGAARAVLVAIAAREGTRVIVTSRDALGAEGEIAVAVDPLAEEDALALYTTLSGAPADDDARAIVRRLDALPLAIELAAARAPLLGSAELLARLDRKLDVLGGARHATEGRPARHATLRATIAWSWELLEERGRFALMACATFEGLFDAALAEAVIDIDRVRESDAMDTLEQLRERALLHVAPADEAGRPQLHLLEAVRDFAREQLTEHGTKEAMFQGHAHAVLTRTESLAARVVRGGAVDHALARRRGDLLAACERVTPALGARAALVLAALLSVTGPTDVVVAITERIANRLVDAEESERALVARIALARGDALRAMGRHEEADLSSKQALAITASVGREQEPGETRRLEADAQRLAGLVARARGESERAIELLSSARDAYRDLGERALAGMCLGEIGAAHQSGGDMARARVVHAEAIAVHVAEDSVRAEGVERSYLAVATHRAGDPAASLALHEAALVIHRRVGHRRLEGAELLHVGFVHHELASPGPARAALLEARRVLATAGARGLEALALVLTARLEADEGNFAEARVALAEASRAAPHGWARLEATQHVVRGHLALASGDAAAAAVAYREANEASLDVEVGFEALTPAYLALALARRGEEPAIVRAAFDVARGLVARVANPHVPAALAILDGTTSTASEEALAASSEVRRALRFVGSRRPLIIADEARRVVLPDGRAIDLSRRKNIRLVLVALAEARRVQPGVPLSPDALVAAGWPEEKMRAGAATKRLHTAVWTLRSLGLEDVLLSSEDGYCIDPKLGIALQ